MPRKKVNKTKASEKRAKKKIDNLSQTHGKEEGVVPTTLEQIWGGDGSDKYKTLDEDEYSKTLNSMGKSDLQAHASKIGLIPIDDRTQLSTRLLREFRKHVARYQPSANRANVSKAQLDEESIRILSEGK